MKVNLSEINQSTWQNTQRTGSGLNRAYHVKPDLPKRSIINQ